MPLRKVDRSTLTFIRKAQSQQRKWERHLDSLQDAQVGDTFILEPESGAEFPTDPKVGLTLRQYKVQLTKAVESLSKGIEYTLAVDEDRNEVWSATILEAPRKRPAYKPKGQASEAGNGQRGSRKKSEGAASE